MFSSLDACLPLDVCVCADHIKACAGWLQPAEGGLWLARSDPLFNGHQRRSLPLIMAAYCRLCHINDSGGKRTTSCE